MDNKEHQERRAHPTPSHDAEWAEILRLKQSIAERDRRYNEMMERARIFKASVLDY